MQTSAPAQEELRKLSELRLDRPVVLSLYLDLDPSQFATPPARATAARSLLDDADRKIRELGDLQHADKVDLQATLERCRQFLEREMPTAQAHAVAVFACESEGLFEAIRLPRAVPSRVSVGRAPAIGALARLDPSDRWCVVLVNKRKARVFHGSPVALLEVDEVEDDVHGRHDQGGWSQARYQRGIEKEVEEHLQRAGDVVMSLLSRRPFERLATAGPDEVVSSFEKGLHPYLAERLAGRIEADVENTSADAVLKAAGPLFDRLADEREREALERVAQGRDNGGRAAAGLLDVLQALNEQRVESLLLGERFSAAGTVCPQCGWVGPEGPRRCPVDGTALETSDDVAEPAVELAVRQAAEVLPIRRHDGELDGGIGAVLRF